MSTVVGTCEDCIVSLPVQPSTSMVFEVQVSEGIRSVIKRLGFARGYYPADNVGSSGLALAPGGSYSTGPVTSLLVSTDQPIQVTVSVAGQAMTFNVKSLLILDDAYDSVTVTNPGAATQNAQVGIYTTSNAT